MAISIHGNAGAWAASNATTQTVTLPTHATGDMLIVRTIRKPFTNPDDTVINDAGWAAVATGVANGATANGNGVGSMGFKAFWKIAESAAEANPTVTWGTTAAPGAACAVVYQKGAGEGWVTPTGNGGGDATARTSQTSTIASHISVTAGDMVDFFRGQCDDSGALTVPTITQSGVTFGVVAEEPAAALLSGTSNDIAADGGYRLATAGTSSAAAVVTGTSAASEQHGAWMTRLRVSAADDAPAEVATATGLANNAVGGVKASAGSAAASGDAAAPKPNISPSVGLADATGAALDATVDAQSASGTSVDAELAEATGSALNATASTTEVPEGPPGAVGVALAPAMSVAVNAATATAIGSAGAITASTTDTAPAETATAVGAARDATISTASVVSANAGLASAIGQAADATTASTGPIEADAGLASASGAAYGALIRIGGGGRGGRVIVRQDDDEDELIAQLLLVA